jgi:ribosomal protein S27AE
MANVDGNRVIEHLRQKWGANRFCPMCGVNQWSVQDSMYQLLQLNQGAALVIGSPVIPVIPVVCNNCGNTVLVNAIAAGLMTPNWRQTHE